MEVKFKFKIGDPVTIISCYREKYLGSNAVVTAIYDNRYNSAKPRTKKYRVNIVNTGEVSDTQLYCEESDIMEIEIVTAHCFKNKTKGTYIWLDDPNVKLSKNFVRHEEGDFKRFMDS